MTETINANQTVSGNVFHDWTQPRLEDRLYDVLSRRLFPSTVESILAAALNGDLVEQTRLFEIMVDTWPRLAHNMRSLRDALAQTPVTVHPAAGPDGTVSREAEERAKLVERALWGMKPDTTRLQDGGLNLLRILAEGTVLGHSVIEILWDVRDDEEVGVATMPKAVRRVHPNYFAWPNGWSQAGKKGEDRLMFRPSGKTNGALTDFPDNQFLIQICRAHGGHPAVAALMRVLAKHWCAYCFGYEWLLKFAQLFGIPFRWVEYPAGNEAVRSAAERALANMGSAGYAAIPSGATFNIADAARGGESLPQKAVMEMADKACDLAILGQTLSADTHEGRGSYALGKVHNSVRKDCLAAVAAVVAETLTQQFAPAVLRLNYGDDSFSPEIRIEIPDERDMLVEAQVARIFLKELGVPVPEQWFRDKFNLPAPADGEPVLEIARDPLPGAENETGARAEAKAAGGDAREFQRDLTAIYEHALTKAQADAWAALQLTSDNGKEDDSDE